MSRVIFGDTYIVVVPTFTMVEMHAHPMLHLFVGHSTCKINVNDNTIQGKYILLDTNVKHTLKKDIFCELFYLLDPTSRLAKKLKEKYLKDSNCKVLPEFVLEPLGELSQKSDSEIISFSDDLFSHYLDSDIIQAPNDTRIDELIKKIHEGSYINMSVSDIAKSVYLSESRLQHLFKEQMNISLKNFLLVQQLKSAYQLILKGKNITYASMEAGFSSPAHLAATCKKYTGISITNVMPK